MPNKFDQNIWNEITSGGITIQVPCSTSNLGPGFDCLGAALDQFLTIQVLPAEDEFALEYSGGYQPNVPATDNLIVTTLKRILPNEDDSLPPLRLVVESEIPTGGGLGSSAAAIAGGGGLGQLLRFGSVDRKQLFKHGFQIEGHPDNIAPSVFGGVTLAYLAENDEPRSEQITSTIPDLYLIRPDIQIKTEEARKRLPDTVPHENAVFNLTRTGLLVHALSNDRPELLDKAMQDRIHQPFRAELLPGGEDILKAGRNAGALGVWISGAGPTLACFVKNGNEAPPKAMTDVLESHGVSTEYTSANLCPSGLSISGVE